MVILISDKIDFKTRTITRDKMGRFYYDKLTWESTDYKYMCPNKRVPKYINQKLTEVKGETDISTIINWDFNISLSKIDRTTR